MDHRTLGNKTKLQKDKYISNFTLFYMSLFTVFRPDTQCHVIPALKNIIPVRISVSCDPDQRSCQCAQIYVSCQITSTYYSARTV